MAHSKQEQIEQVAQIVTLLHDIKHAAQLMIAHAEEIASTLPTSVNVQHTMLEELSTQSNWVTSAQQSLLRLSLRSTLGG